jgi:hypothetical protein
VIRTHYVKMPFNAHQPLSDQIPDYYSPLIEMFQDTRRSFSGDDTIQLRDHWHLLYLVSDIPEIIGSAKFAGTSWHRGLNFLHHQVEIPDDDSIMLTKLRLIAADVGLVDRLTAWTEQDQIRFRHLQRAYFHVKKMLP